MQEALLSSAARKHQPLDDEKCNTPQYANQVCTGLSLPRWPLEHEKARKVDVNFPPAQLKLVASGKRFTTFSQKDISGQRSEERQHARKFDKDGPSMSVSVTTERDCECEPNGGADESHEIESVQEDSELDDESLYEESPADGSFTERSHPSETFVANAPSASATSKAEEVAEQSMRGENGYPPPRRSSSASSMAPHWRLETAPILDAGPPPPDYAAATATRSPTQASSQHSNDMSGGSVRRHNDYGSVQHPPNLEAEQDQQLAYSERGNPFGADFSAGASGGPFGPDGVFNRNGLFTNSQQPLSMSDDAAQTTEAPIADEETGLLSQPSKRRTSRKCAWVRKCYSPMCFSGTFFVIMIVLFVAFVVKTVRLGSDNDDKDQKPIDDGNDNGGRNRKQHNKPDILPNITHPGSSICPFAHTSITYSFEFNDRKSFVFVELTESSSFYSGHIGGEVNVRAAQPDQDADVLVWVSYALTAPYTVKHLQYDISEDGLVLHMPSLGQSTQSSNNRPCMDIFVDIQVRPGVKLEDWQVSTANLNILVHDGLFNREPGQELLSALHLANSSMFSSTSGDLMVDYWSSRSTRIELASGSVKGTYALRDLLSIHTSSGSQDIIVVPKAVDKDDPKPAEFSAISSSGSIKTYFPVAGDIPSREYHSRIESSSSSLDGTYFLGAMTTFKTSSGSIHASLLPLPASFINGTTTPVLHTETHSGTTRLDVLTPYEAAGESWGSLSHKSTSSSGSVSLVYPSEWEGTVEGRSSSGSISVKGKDVKIVSDRREGSLWRFLIARKGWGKGKIDARTTSGSVKVKIGDE